MEVENDQTKVFTDNFDPEGVDKRLPSHYYAPPTVEELQELRETEHLFRSNLIRLQIDELLKEVQIPDNVQRDINEFVQKLKTKIGRMKERDTRTDVLTHKMFLPSLSLTSTDNIAADFTFLPPADVRVIGSYHDNSILWYGKEVTVDLMVTMPKAVFTKADFVNMRYFVKRSLYAEEVMKQLTESLSSEVPIEFKLDVDCDDYRRPYLLVFPKGQDKFRVRIMFVPEQGTFQSKRFDVGKSCLRNNWYSGDPDPNTHLISSPLTNQSILVDIVCHDLNLEIHKRISTSVSYVNALKLLKVWLRQHCLSSVANGFTNFIAKSLLAVMTGKKKVSPQMSHYQIFRCVLSYLATTQTLNISFGEKTIPGGNPDFPAVILWEDGILNISSNLSRCMFAMVQTEAKRSIELLDRESGFQRIFIEPVRADLYFDNFISVEIRNEELSDAADYCNLKYLKLCRVLPELLRRTLTDRMLLIVNLSSSHHREWDTSDSSIPVPKSLLFGVLYSEEYKRIVERSSSPENDAEFSQFWGSLSEARKFSDGSVVEAVVWPASHEIDRHHVWTKMVEFALKRHLDDQTVVHFTSDQLDKFVAYPSESVKDILTRNRRTTDVINEISELLHSVEGLPLTIGSVWAELCTGFRGSEPADNDDDSIPLVCKLEVSPRWPKHLSAIRRLTLAFCVRLCRWLRQRNVKCAISFWKGKRTVLLSYKGCIFRMFLLTDAEIRVCREEGKLWTPNQWELLHVCTWLSGIKFEYPLWPYVVCLCKRWMSGNFLLSEWSEVTVEILCAHIFTNPEPLASPRSLILAFKRFLTLIATHNWYDDPILSKTEKIDGDHISAFLMKFKTERNRFPAATVVTDGPDPECPLVIHKSPSALLVKRTIQLAERCLEQLQTDKILSNSTKIQEIFNGSMSMCDVRIIIDRNVKPVGTDGCFGFGYVDFDPTEIFLQSLKDSYGQFALFLYDKYGGDQIGVVWKKNMLEPRPLTVQSASAGGGQLTSRKRTSTNRLLSYDPMQFIEQWKILGLGVVKSIHGKTN